MDTALKVSNNILNAIERLEQFPNSGSVTPDKRLNEMEYRMVICEKYVAIYRQIGEAIFVHHITDTQAEYTRLFC